MPKVAKQVHCLFALVFIVSTLLATAAVTANTRIALVIGNADYGRFGTLPTPTNDARLMAATLSELGFQVRRKSNLKRRELKAEFTNFLKAARLADVALIYYSGYQLTLNDKSYLTPIGEAPTSVNAAQLSMVSVEALMRRLSDAATQNILILEGGWKSPVVANLGGYLEQGSVTSLRSSPIVFAGSESLASGRLVMMTAASENKLNPVENQNTSIFTQGVAQAISLPGLQANEAFSLIPQGIAEQTEGMQMPAVYGSLRSPLYLAGQPLVVPETSGKPALAQQKWATIQNSNITEEIQGFLDEFGDTPLAGVAMSRIQSLNAIDPEERQRLRETTIERRALLKSYEQEKKRKNEIVAQFKKEKIRVQPIFANFDISGNVAVRAEPGSQGSWLGLYKDGDVAQVRGAVVGKNWLQVEWQRDADGAPVYGYFFGKSAEPQSTSDFIVWRAISENPTVESLQVYLQNFPNGFYRFDAVEMILNTKYPNALASKSDALENFENISVDLSGLQLAASELPSTGNTSSQSLTITSPNSGPTSILIPEMGYRLDLFEEEYITTSFANLRRLPWIKTRKMAEVDRDTKIVVTGKVREEDWFRVKWGDGRDLYVHGSNVEPFAGSEFELWQESKSTGEIADLNFYLQYYASGRFALQARELIQQIRLQQDGGGQDILVPVANMSANLPSGADELINVRPLVFDGKINRSISASLMHKFGSALKTRVSNENLASNNAVLDISGRVIDVRVTDAKSSTFIALGNLLGDRGEEAPENALSTYGVVVELSAQIQGDNDPIISISEHVADIGPETAQSLAIQITMKKAFDQAANIILQKLNAEF